MTPILSVGAVDAAMAGGGFGTHAVRPAASFGDVLMQGLQMVDGKVASADAMVRQFALDDSIPVHQVTIALEQSRLAVELAMQIRGRLLEGYRDIMSMQL